MSHLNIDALVFRTAAGATLLGPISLVIGEGERWAVVGPNGAGKTTLLRLIAGRLSPSEGTLLLDGQALHDMSGAERARRFAVLAQGDQADSRLRVADYVALGRLPHQGRCDAARHATVLDEAMALCGVTQLRDRTLASLSGGERQRAHLARALAQEPSLLLLDEPTNHLDLRARVELLDLIRGLAITVVVVLHELSLVAGFADRVAVLDGGRLAVLGTPSAALSPAVVARVFGLDVFPAVHPQDGRRLLVFDRIAA